jgi:tetratricopeptide (TPR) repeat protein
MARADRALELFEKARARVAPGSVHGRRLALVDDFLQGLRRKREQLAQKRGPVPKLRLVGDARGIVIDGSLDDDYWQKCPVAATGSLRELQTGRLPTFGTTVKAGWQGGSVCFAIRCEERPGEAPRDAAARADDAAIWQGDLVEILIATETHSYYQIAVSPSGRVVDLDRSAAKGQRFGWESRAEVATRIADDHWTVEIRLPVTADENDPLNQIIGRKPTQSLPWHINICRQRQRADGVEHSALSPTGAAGFHVPLKFAHFYDGRSHAFEVDPEAVDFVLKFRRTELLRKPAEALAAQLELAKEAVTELQRSVALREATRSASALKDHARAEQIVAEIPIEAVRKTARMDILLAAGRAAEVVSAFAGEEIETWPFWQRGEGHHARGRAHHAVGAGAAGEADLVAALGWIPDPRERQGIALTLGRHRESVVKDESGALAAYRSVFDGQDRVNGATQYYAVQAAARLLMGQGRFDEALATLARIDTDTLRGTWRHSTLIARGDVHAAAGDRVKAEELWRGVLGEAPVEARHRRQAEERLGRR